MKYVFWGLLLLSFLLLRLSGVQYWWVLVLLIASWFAYLALGAFNLSLGIFTNAITKLDNSGSAILLTFDDGPDPVYTSTILDILKEFNARAVFFCIGHKIEKNPELVKRIAAEGHWVANHSYVHSNLIGFYSKEKVKEELEKTEKLIVQHTGFSHGLFRPPFGVTNPKIARAADELHFKVIGWNKRSFDTVSSNKEEILKRISNKLSGGDIILLHDTMANTPEVLRSFLTSASTKGFTFKIDNL